MRLDTHAEDVLRSATDFSDPFDNNLCERDVRMVIIAQKISGGFRSTEGAENFHAFQSYLSTAAMQGVNRLAALQQLSNGNPWSPTVPRTAHETRPSRHDRRSGPEQSQSMKSIGRSHMIRTMGAQ